MCELYFKSLACKKRNFGFFLGRGDPLTVPRAGLFPRIPASRVLATLRPSPALPFTPGGPPTRQRGLPPGHGPPTPAAAQATCHTRSASAQVGRPRPARLSIRAHAARTATYPRHPHEYHQNSSPPTRTPWPLPPRGADGSPDPRVSPTPAPLTARRQTAVALRRTRDAIPKEESLKCVFS